MNIRVIKQLIQNTLYPQIILNRDFEIIYYNNKAYDIIKSDLGIEINNDFPVFNLINEKKDFVKSIFNQVLSGETLDFIFETKTPSGIKFLKYIYTPIYDDNNYISSISISVMDLTELKNIEKKLYESNERYNHIATHKKDFIIRLNSSGKILYINNSFSHLLNKANEDILNTNIKSILSQIDYEKVTREINKLINQSGTKNFVLKINSYYGWKSIEWEAAVINTPKNLPSEIQLLGREISDYETSIVSFLETENILQNILNTTPHAIAVLDIDRKVKYWNKSAESLFNINEKSIMNKKITMDLIGKNFHLFKNVEKIFNNILLSEKHIIAYTDKNKKVKVDLMGIPLKNNNGDIYSALFLIQDLTKKYNEESELRKLNSIINFCNLGVGILNRQLKIETINDKFEEMTGLCLKNLKNKKLRNILPSQYSTMSDSELIKIFSEDKNNIPEINFKEISGLNDWINLSISPVFFKNLIDFYIIIAENITDKKKIGNELDLAKNRLSSIMGSFDNYIFYDYGGSTPFFSNSVKKVLGYESHEMLKNSNFPENIIHPDDIKKFNSDYDEWMNDPNRKSWKSQFRCIKKNKECIVVENTMNKVHDEAGTVLNGILIDITETFESQKKFIWNSTLLKTMTESTKYAYYAVNNKTGEILYANEKYLEMWELGNLSTKIFSKEITHNEILDICHKKVINSSDFLKSMTDYNNPSNNLTFEDELKLINGRTIRRFSTILLDDKNNYLGRFYLYEDISDKKLSEKITRQKHEFNAIIEESIDCIIITDHQGVIKYVNTNALKLLNYNREVLINKNINSLIFSDDGKNLPYNIEIKGNSQTIMSTLRILSPGDKLITVESHTKLLTNGHLQISFREVENRFKLPVYDSNVNIYFNLFHKLKLFKHGESSITCLSRLLLLLKNFEYVKNNEKGKLSKIPFYNRLDNLIKDYINTVNPQLSFICTLLKLILNQSPTLNAYESFSKINTELLIFSENLNEKLLKLQTSINKRNIIKKSFISDIIESLTLLKSNFKSLISIFDFTYATPIDKVFDDIKIHYNADYNFHININTKNTDSKIIFNKYEFYDIIKIILDNSCEEFEKSKINGSLINIDVSKSSENIIIEIFDNGPGVNELIQQNIFDKGISTKGENRGFGLNYALNTVTKYGGTIELDTNYSKGAKFILKLITI